MNVPDAVQEKDMTSKFVIRTLSLGRRQPCAVTRGPPPPGDSVRCHKEVTLLSGVHERGRLTC